MYSLRAKRQQAGLTMTELATRAGLELSKLSRLERGILKLKVDDLIALAEVLGCDVNELIAAANLTIPEKVHSDSD